MTFYRERVIEGLVTKLRVVNDRRLLNDINFQYIQSNVLRKTHTTLV